MLIETIIVGGAIVASHQIHRALCEQCRRRDADEAAAASWVHAIQTSQEINSQLSAARQAMVEEVRRTQRRDHDWRSS